MTPGQRWLAAGAPWVEGMRTENGWRVVVVGARDVWVSAGVSDCPERLWPSAAPDLTDAATKGAALGWLREAWGEPALTLYHDEWSDGSEGWRVVCDHEVPGLPGDLHDTEADALVAAAEALRGREA